MCYAQYREAQICKEIAKTEMMDERLEEIRQANNDAIAIRERIVEREPMDADTWLSELLDEIDRLRKVCREAQEVCLCLCPMEDHENYGEDGFSCDDPMHECNLVCVAAASTIDRLRKERDELKAKWLKAEESLNRSEP